MTFRQEIDPDLHPMLLNYALHSQNAAKAVFLVQQMGKLIPRYQENLEWIDEGEPTALDEVREVWGVMADIVGAMTGLPPTLETLVTLGYQRAADVDGIIRVDEIVSSLPSIPYQDLGQQVGGVLSTMRSAIELFDFKARNPDTDTSLNDMPLSSFAEMINEIDNVRRDFPYWDGRPLFLQEQKAFLLYLGMSAAVAVINEYLPEV